MSNSMVIGNRHISASHAPYIIAEVSANHNGSISRAMETIQAAKDAGVSAVKIQTYTPDTMTIDVDNDDFVINEGLWQGRTLYDLYTEACTPFEWHDQLFEFAKKIGITLFSSPFDESAVDLLESLNAPAYKIASFELVDLPLISYVAKTKKPMFMSTGMASMSEIGEAIEVARTNGCNDLAIFHCISSYPAPIDQLNLQAIPFLRKEFGIEVGLSDHTLGNLASVVATSLGATVIEKHFTLSRSDGGVDSAFSLEPNEMKAMVKETKDAYLALGAIGGVRAEVEQGNKIFRRSLYFVKDITKGDKITEKHIRRIRPGFGLEPKYYFEVIGKEAARNATRGERVTLNSFR